MDNMRSQINNLLYTQIFVSVVNQKYKVQVHDEYVMSGNTAVLKCQVSSFVLKDTHINLFNIQKMDNQI